MSCVGCGALLHHLFSPRKFVTIRTPPAFFPTVIMGAHQSDVSPAGTGSMIPILTAAFSSSLARFLNETGMLYGVMTFVGLAFSDLSDIFISGTFIVGSSWVVQVLKAVARNMPCSISSTFSCAASGHSAASGAMLKFRFAILIISFMVLYGGS